MDDRLQRIETRLIELEKKLARGHDHLLTVMATQRERVDRAFDEVKIALLEQELALKNHLQIIGDGVGDLRASVGDLLAAASDHEDRLRQLEHDLRVEFEARLKRLEGRPPPAAA